jgi:murein tripeptide amidase MpaA
MVVENNWSKVKILVSVVVAFSMILPAAAVVSGIQSVTIPSSGDESGQSATVTLGDMTYKVWIEGEQHFSYIMFSSSADCGISWNEPERITGPGIVPMSLQLQANGKNLHLVWMDGQSKLLRSFYLRFDTGTQNWQRALELRGESPSLSVEGNAVVIATRAEPDLLLSISQDGGRSFVTCEPMTSIACTRPVVLLENGDINVACIGGVLQGTQTVGRGIYYTHSKVGQTNIWAIPTMLADTPDYAREISMTGEDTGLSISWTEVTESSFDSYTVTETSPGDFGEKALAGSEPYEWEQPEQSSARAPLPPKKWSFFVYLDADNNLDGFGWEDLNEMEQIGSNTDINIVVLFDGNTVGGPDSHCYYIQEDTNGTGMGEADVISYEYPLTDINPSWTGGEVNMGVPQTAIDFLDWAFTNFPADRYLLDMWDHGGSWDWAMCSDDTSGTHLSALDVRTIYETLRVDTGKIKLFDVAGYDECLMADMSLYYDELPFIDYMCNSEDSIGGDGWEYNYVLGHINGNPDMNGEECAFWVFQSYVDRYGTSGLYTTMSVINGTMFFSSLMPAINNLAQKGIHDITAHRGNLQSAANSAQSWQGYTHQRDLYHFCNIAIGTITSGDVHDALQSVLDAATANPVGTQYGDPAWQSDRAIMIHNQNTNEHGMKVYVNDPPYNSLYNTMTVTDTNWDEFYIVLWGTDPDQPNNEPTVSITSPPDGGFVTVDTTCTVTGTAADSDGTVTRVDCAPHTQHWAAATGTTTWSYDWDTTGWAPGWYRVNARSFDGQDFSSVDFHDVQIIIDPDLPDLTLWSNDIGFSNPTPNEGDIVTIDATVYNVGTVDDAVGVEIGFYDGDPAAGGALIGITPATPSTIPAGNNSGWGSVAWNTAGEAGYHDIYVVADPQHTIPELTDANNTRSRSIIVAGYNVDLECPDNEHVIQAGMTTDYQIYVTNTGTMTDTITLTINNPTSWNANFNNNPPSSKDSGSGSNPAPLGRPVNGYHTFPEIEAELSAIAAAHPDICQLYSIGQSWESRELWVMKVSDNPTQNESEPEVYINGGIHAREWIADEVPLYYLNWLVDNYGTDTQATWLVDNRQIYISPCVNPDGLVYCQNVGDWRKNRRDNGDGTFGVDLNRNWAGACNGDPSGDWGGAGASHTTGSETYCGPSAFSEPETQAMRDFILAHDFQIMITYHSWAEEVYWPWGYDTAVQTPHDAYQSALAVEFAAINGYTPMQSAASYFTTGDTDDWTYGYNWYTLGRENYPFTIELGTQFQPPQSQITPICQMNLGVNQLATEAVDNIHLDSPVFTHTPLPDTTDFVGPYTVSADITTPHGLLAGQTILYWKTTGAWNPVVMTNTGGDTWEGDIPGQPDGTWVYYYMETEDVNNHRSSEPKFTPLANHRFFVGNDIVTYDVTLDSLETRIVNLTVEAPVTALPSESAHIDVIGTSTNDPTKTDSVETVTTIAPGILLVNDANSAIANYQTALDNNGYYYDVGTPSTPLDDYRIVIWASDGTATLAAADKTALMNFMDAGGSVYVNGEDVGWDIAADDDTAIGLGPSPNNFYGLYMHANYLADDSLGTYMNGVAGDILDGMSNLAITGNYPEEISPNDGFSSTILVYGDGSPGVGAGIKSDTGTYRMVYIGCEYFEGADSQVEKDEVMYRIIEWLNPDSSPVVMLTNPAGSEEIHYGMVDITWSTADDQPLPAGCIELFYSTDIGATWNPIASGLDDTGSYIWDTGFMTDGNSYCVGIRVTDSIGQQSTDMSPECFSIDNTADDRWYLQVESTNLGTYLDLDMKPAELSVQEIVLDVSGPGEFEIDSFASEYVATGDIDLAGAWTFNMLGKVSSAVADGRLYAEVYADDGTPRLMFTTSYDDQDVGTYMTYHEFNWGYTVPPGTMIQTGEHICVRVMLHATSGAASSPHYWYADADIPVIGTVTNDYSATLVSDNTREGITEMGGISGTLYSNDFASNPTDWTITHTSGTAWTWANQRMEHSYGYPNSGYLDSPVIDCTGRSGVGLDFWHFWQADYTGGTQDGYVRGSIDGGSTWPYLIDEFHHNNPPTETTVHSYSLAWAAGQSQVRIRYDIYNNDDWYWRIDNFFVNASVDTSLCEHKWTIDVPTGEAPYAFNVEARRTNNAEGDNFVFAYSTDDVSYTDMVTVNSWTETTYTYGLPAGLSGTVYIRVQDTDRTSGNNNLDSIQVDQMYISSVGGAPQFTLGLDHFTMQSYIGPVLNPGSLPTFDIPILVTPGWNFISYPLLIGGAVQDILNDAPGDGLTTWDIVRWNDVNDPLDPWKIFTTFMPPSLCDLPDVNNTMGLWVHVTAVGDGFLTVQGIQPVSTPIILKTGWNLVGYPSVTPRNAAVTLPGTVDGIAIFDEFGPYQISDEALGSVTMQAGNAYWVHCTADAVWTVDW